MQLEQQFQALVFCVIFIVKHELKSETLIDKQVLMCSKHSFKNKILFTPGLPLPLQWK